MADQYIEVPVTTDEPTLADGAVEALQVRWPGWEPNDGNLEVVLIEQFASMVADAAATAAQVPGTIFRSFGQTLAGVPYQDGAEANVPLLVTMIDTSGGTIPEGSEVEIDGFVFATDQDLVIAPGGATGLVTATATEPGADANDLIGTNVNLISALAAVNDVVVVAPSSGGAEPETDEAYLNRLSLAMELRGITLVTTRDFELMALTEADVARVVATHLGARQVRVTGITAGGTSLTTPTKDALLALFAQYRMVNTTVTMVDPAFKAVNVTYAVQAYPGFDAADLEARINAALAELLSPLTWGQPSGAHEDQATWYNEPRVRVLKLVDKIGNIDGVDYVVSIALSAAPRTGVTGVASTDVITLAFHGFSDAARVKLSTLAGGAGLSSGITYFVRDVTTNTFKLAATAGGAPINFTTDITTATGIAPDVETNGDLILPGDVPLPTPGTMDGTIT